MLTLNHDKANEIKDDFKLIKFWFPLDLSLLRFLKTFIIKLTSRIYHLHQLMRQCLYAGHGRPCFLLFNCPENIRRPDLIFVYHFVEYLPYFIFFFYCISNPGSTETEQFMEPSKGNTAKQAIFFSIILFRGSNVELVLENGFLIIGMDIFKLNESDNYLQ